MDNIQRVYIFIFLLTVITLSFLAGRAYSQDTQIHDLINRHLEREFYAQATREDRLDAFFERNRVDISKSFRSWKETMMKRGYQRTQRHNRAVGCLRNFSSVCRRRVGPVTKTVDPVERRRLGRQRAKKLSRCRTNCINGR